ncbi:IS1 family transposase [Photobacterium leiognathi]|uniref:IS1 family transposase n=1 Tax=Photobacterium leiognathi TaxID=553611 RepID=UPI00387F38DF
MLQKKPRWLFYTYDRVKRKLLCYVFGCCTEATLNRLLTLLVNSGLNVLNDIIRT